MLGDVTNGSELAGEVVKIGERHLGEHLLLEVMGDLIENRCGHLHVLAVEEVLVIKIDTEAFPVVTDDVQHDVVLLGEAVALVLEANDTLVQVVGVVAAVFPEHGAVGHALDVVDGRALDEAMLLEGGDVEHGGEGSLGGGERHAQVGLLGSVEASQRVLDGGALVGGVVDVQVESHGRGCILVDGVHYGAGDESLSACLTILDGEDGSVGDGHFFSDRSSAAVASTS